MKAPDRRAGTFDRASLFATVVLAVAVAAIWAARVPIFQEPDERAHADYAFALADVGHPFVVTRAVPGINVTPETQYLSRATRFRENRYAPHVRMPHGYGSAAYFAALDRAAPMPISAVPAAGAALPYAMFSYPAGYYAVAALAMRIAAIVHPDSISARFFAARAIGVLCLLGTMLLGYDIFLRLRVSRATATIATFAIGLLPLTSWVSGYVQPDVLTTLLLTAAIAASLRWKEHPSGIGEPLALAFALACLALVKEHYAIATIAATALAACSRPSASRRPWILAGTFALPLGALYFATHFSPAGAAVPPRLGVFRTTGLSVVQRIGDFAAFVFLGLRDTYAGGDAFDDFWLRFGFHPSDSIFPGYLVRIVRNLLVAATLGMIALFVARERFVFGRLVAVTRRRSAVAALRLCVGDPLINVYAIVTLILLSVYAYANGLVWLEGRYWLPVIVPTLAIVTVHAVRLFRKVSTRRRAGRIVASAWAAYALVSAAFGIAAIERSFYAPGPPLTREPYAKIVAATADSTCAAGGDSGRLRVRAGCVVHVSGYAIDGTRGLPATDIFLVLDGRRIARARTRLPSQTLVYTYNDRALARSGFDALLQTRSLAPGGHAIGIAIVEADAPLGRSAQNTIPIDVLR